MASLSFDDLHSANISHSSNQSLLNESESILAEDTFIISSTSVSYRIRNPWSHGRGYLVIFLLVPLVAITFFWMYLHHLSRNVFFK